MTQENTEKNARIKILGTSHVAQESVEEIQLAIDSFDPDIVAVELDKNRLYSLMHNKKNSLSPKMIFHIGVWGYLLAVVGQYVQQKIGGKLGIIPGKDMLTGVKYGKLKGKNIALIDQNIQITLKRVSKLFSFKDKLALFSNIVEGLIFPKRSQKKMKKVIGDIDLSKVPEKELVIKMMKLLQKDYPGLYKALVDERNHIMCKNVIGLSKHFPEKKILVIVGAGHVKGMLDIFKHNKVLVVHE